MSIADPEQITQLFPAHPRQTFNDSREQLAGVGFIPGRLPVKRVSNDVPDSLGLNEELVDAVQWLIFIELMECLEAIEEVATDLR
ncbi:MAG TPA: hypothetical protein VKA35_02635 [Solirubrobacterales bacterium]|nr:hypothetical protein [Solirubrobacterales bacterium]